MDCPKCSVGKLNEITVRANNLYRAVALQGEGTSFELKLDQCFVCNGVWFDAGELQKYLSENCTIVNSPEIDRPLIEKADKKISKCPHCNVDMVKLPAPKAPGITIDSCSTCQGIWLDSGELDRLELKNLGHKKRFGVEFENLFRRLFNREKDDE